MICLRSLRGGDCWETMWLFSAVDVLVSAFAHTSDVLSIQDHKDQPWLSRIHLEVLRSPLVPSRAS